MSSFSTPKMDRDLEYSKFHERKLILASTFNIKLQRTDVDKTRYEEKGAQGPMEIYFYSEGEGSAQGKKHGYFEVIKLTLRKFSAQNKLEESISLNYENSELYTSFRDRDFWLEYLASDLNALKKKFPVYEENTGDPLRDKVLHEFGRLAEKSTKAPLQDSVFYVSLSLPMTGIEELMYQVLSGDLSKKLEVSTAAMKAIAAHTGQTADQPAPAHQAVAPQTPAQHPPAKAAATHPLPPETAATQLPDPEIEPGIGLLSAKRYEEAVEYYKNKAKKSPKDPEGWFGLSACLFLTGEIKKCTLYYNRCLDIDPGFDIIGRLIILSNNDLQKLGGLAENLLTLELNKEAQKYIDYLKDKLPPEEIEHLVNLQKKSL